MHRIRDRTGGDRAASAEADASAVEQRPHAVEVAQPLSGGAALRPGVGVGTCGLTPRARARRRPQARHVHIVPVARRARAHGGLRLAVWPGVKLVMTASLEMPDHGTENKVTRKLQENCSARAPGSDPQRSRRPNLRKGSVQQLVREPRFGPQSTQVRRNLLEVGRNWPGVPLKFGPNRPSSLFAETMARIRQIRRILARFRQFRSWLAKCGQTWPNWAKLLVSLANFRPTTGRCIPGLSC